MRLSRPAPRTEALFHALSCVPQSRQKRDTRLGSPRTHLPLNSLIPICIIQQNPAKVKSPRLFARLRRISELWPARPRACLAPPRAAVPQAQSPFCTTGLDEPLAGARPGGAPASSFLPRTAIRRRCCPASDTLLVSRSHRIAFMRSAGIRCSAKIQKGRRIEYKALSLQRLRLRRVADGRAEAWRGPHARSAVPLCCCGTRPGYSFEGTFCYPDLTWPNSVS